MARKSKQKEKTDSNEEVEKDTPKNDEIDIANIKDIDDEEIPVKSDVVLPESLEEEEDDIYKSVKDEDEEESYNPLEDYEDGKF